INFNSLLIEDTKKPIILEFMLIYMGNRERRIEEYKGGSGLKFLGTKRLLLDYNNVILEEFRYFPDERDWMKPKFIEFALLTINGKLYVICLIEEFDTINFP